MKGYIRQRSKGKWEITIDTGRDPSTDKRLRHFETIVGGKKEAQHRLAELLLNIKKGMYIKQPKQLTVDVWLRQWLDSYVASNLSPKTRQSYEQELRCYIIPELGWVRLSELRPHHIQEYIAKALSEGRIQSIGGLSSRTVQYHYRILSKSLDDAIRMGLIAVNACKGVSPPRSVRKDVPSIGLEDINKLLDVMKGSSFYLFYYTLLLTGLRRSELLALRWNDLDLDLACIYVSRSLHRLDDGTIIIKEPKTSRSRRPVDLPPSLAVLLRQHKDKREAEHKAMSRPLTEDDFVFSHANGTPLNPNTVSHTFSKIVARAGLSHLSLHDLRHIHATMLLKAGTHPRIVQERLGHSSIATTLDIYSHTVPGLQKAAAERLDTLLPLQEQKENVGKMSAEGGDLDSRPCRSRTCDTLIKSQADIFADFDLFSKLESARKVFSF
jgi:integrase